VKELKSQLKKKEKLKFLLDISNGLVDSFKKFFKDMTYKMQEMSDQLYKYEDVKKSHEIKERSIHLMLISRDLIKRVLPNITILMPYGQEEKPTPIDKNVINRN